MYRTRIIILTIIFLTRILAKYNLKSLDWACIEPARKRDNPNGSTINYTI